MTYAAALLAKSSNKLNQVFNRSEKATAALAKAVERLEKQPPEQSNQPRPPTQQHHQRQMQRQNGHRPPSNQRIEQQQQQQQQNGSPRLSKSERKRQQDVLATFVAMGSLDVRAIKAFSKRN